MENDDFYKKLRRKVERWIKTKEGEDHHYSKYILMAPDIFHLLVKLSLDPRVAASEKAKLIAAIAYFISPIDLIPEALVGPIGYLDDIALAGLVLNGLLRKNVDESLIREHWAGEDDILDLIRQILELAEKMLGKTIWRNIHNIFGTGNKGGQG